MIRRPISCALALTLAGCPGSSTKDAGKSDAKTPAKTDGKLADAKRPGPDTKTDAKTDAKADAKTDAKADTPTPPEPPPGPPPEVSAEAQKAVANSINAFAVDLHKTLGASPGNLFVSPASIVVAFAMTHAGAKGETASELAKVFHFGESADLHAGMGGMLARWDAASGGLELDVANRLFGEKSVTFEPAYLELGQKVFGAPLEPVDFVNGFEPARVHINDWVSTKTKEKIKDLIPEGGVTADTRMVLVNAIYFKAKWAEPFDEFQSQEGKFHGSAGDETVKFMNKTEHFRLGAAPEAKARVLELGYDGGGYSMVIVLPDDAKGLAAAEAALTPEALTKWIDGATSSARVALTMPRFRIEPGEPLRLRTTLETLGLHVPFDASKADFTGMAPASAQLVISDAYHKAFIAVDEAGTEAAAATAVSMRAGSAAPTDEPVPFVMDHPFLFLVRDTTSGAILFMGRLVDP